MASVTVFGCIVRESEYRAAQEKGHGGLIGTGIGVGNEFILTGATSGNPVSTTGGVGDKGQDYELTGPAEGEAAQFVHKRVAASGYFKPAEKESSLGLRQLKVLSVRAATGQCD